MNKSQIGQLARRISLRQLQVFEAVARHLSYTRAAEELFLSQPTVSMQIKKLETDIDLPLTEQIGKKISLTEAGRELHKATLDILGTLERFEMTMNDQKGLRTGRLRIAVVTTANYFAPRLIGKFTHDYPGINISLEVGNREQLLDRMSRNMDDIYLIGKPPESSELDFQPYLENPMVVVSTISDPLAGLKSIPLAKIAEQPFIIREQGSGTRIAVEQLFAAHDLSLDVRMELGSNESIKQGISGGLGIAVISQHTLTTGDMTELAILDVENFPLSWQWYVGYPHGKRLSIVAKKFIDYMYKEGPSLLKDRIKNR